MSALLTACSGHRNSVDQTRWTPVVSPQVSERPAKKAVHARRSGPSKARYERHNPKWLKRQSNLHARSVPFYFIVDKLLAGTSVVVCYDNNVDRHKMISIAHRGTIAAALRRLQAKTNYAFQIEGNALNWSRYQMHSFDVSYLRHPPHMTRSTRRAIWQEMANTLKQLKSKDGKVILSKRSGMVTIQDFPGQVTRMGHYLGDLQDRIQGKS